MAGAGMRSDTTLMGAAARDVLGVAETLNGDVTTLMNNLSPLYTSWQGSGGTTFQTVRAEVEAELIRLNQALITLAEAVGSSGTDYVVTDDEMRSTMDQVGAPVGDIGRALLVR